MEDTVKSFIRDVELQIRLINEAIFRSYIDQVQKEVHKIESGASGIGADLLSSVAKKMENSRKKNEVEYIKEQMNELTSNFNELKEETRKKL